MPCQQEDLDRYILYALLIIIFYSAVNVMYYRNRCRMLTNEIKLLKTDIDIMIKESKSKLNHNIIFF